MASSAAEAAKKGSQGWVQLPDERTESRAGVFGSTLVDILLEFKWRGFARRKYYVELVLYLIHVVIILIWNIQSQQVLDKEYSFGEMRERLRNLEPTFVTLALLWTWYFDGPMWYVRRADISLTNRGDAAAAT